MRITDRWLRHHHACPKQRERFTRLFPEGVEVTQRALERAERAGLNVAWLGWEMGLKFPGVAKILDREKREAVRRQMILACVRAQSWKRRLWNWLTR